MQRPHEIGGEDETALQHGDDDGIVQPRAGDLAGDFAHAGANPLGAVERLHGIRRKTGHRVSSLFGNGPRGWRPAEAAPEWKS
jgi:hypothetical protein